MKNLLALFIAFTTALHAQTPRTWIVDGVERTGLLFTPAMAKERPTPVVFVFHGHGGSTASISKLYRMEQAWPEAIVVYLQGLNLPGPLSDPEGKKPGWQVFAGVKDDRDLKFFDAVLSGLKSEFKVDARRIYATGHSGGGGFTWLLWRERGAQLAALAPSAAALPEHLRRGPTAGTIPRPIFVIAGERDQAVKIEWIRDVLAQVRAANECAEAGEPWAEKGTLYPSKKSAPLVTIFHPGGHEFVPSASALMARFFKEHALP